MMWARRALRYLTALGPVNLAPIVFRAASIGTDQTAYNDVVIVSFNRAIDSPGTDYSAGVSIEVDATPATISSADLQADGKTVYYTLDAAVPVDGVATWAYSAASGDITDAADSGIVLGDVATTNVPNYIGTQLWFQHSENSGHLATIGL